jgi:threonine synthase
MTGGLLAKRMGLPIHQFVAATNVNDVVPQYLLTKSFKPRSSAQTISNAMDVGNPSNFVRLLDLYQHDFDRLSKDIIGYAFSDEETRVAMRKIFASNTYVMDPHGAVAYLGLKKFLAEHPGQYIGVFSETAHPAKFKEVVDETLKTSISIPEELQKFLKHDKKTIEMSKAFEDLKNYLIETF